METLANNTSDAVFIDKFMESIEDTYEAGNIKYSNMMITITKKI